MSEVLEHNCGLVVAHTLHDAYSMIHSLQHRGREAIIVNYTPPIGIIGEDKIARGRTAQEISELVGMTVRYISLEGLLRGFEKAGLVREELCTYCIGGRSRFEWRRDRFNCS